MEANCVANDGIRRQEQTITSDGTPTEQGYHWLSSGWFRKKLNRQDAYTLVLKVLIYCLEFPGLIGFFPGYMPHCYLFMAN